MVRITSFLALLASFPLIYAHALPSEIFGREDNGRGGCGTVPSEEELAAIAQVMSLDFPDLPSARIAASSAALAPPTPADLSSFGTITVKTWVHVVAASENLIDGWIPDSQVYAQMDELNANFAPNKVQFVLAGITRSVNPLWATDGVPTSEFEMKSALRKGDYKTLNLYFQKTLRNGALGYAYLPRIAATVVGSRAFILDGATNKFDTVPGGTLAPYNLGRTVTHEVGHWMGLLHTFEGLSCTGTGDLIADTPAQITSTRGCPIGLDTCPGQPGLDPIHNYMDYSYDFCYEEFTKLQTKRMFDIWNTFRSPRACSADNCLRALRANTIPGRLQETQAFCQDYTKVIVTDISLIPSYAASACTGNVASRVSSACSCLPTPTTL